MNRMIVAFAVAMLVAPVAASAQGATAGAPADSNAALVHELVERSRSVDLALTAIEANVAAQRQLNARIPAVFWDRFLSVAHERRGDLATMIESVYARHFSADELRQLLAFYDTPIGKKLIALQPTLAQESMAAGKEWGQRIGLEVGMQLQKEGVHAGP